MVAKSLNCKLILTVRFLTCLINIMNILYATLGVCLKVTAGMDGWMDYLFRLSSQIVGWQLMKSEFGTFDYHSIFYKTEEEHFSQFSEDKRGK